MKYRLLTFVVVWLSCFAAVTQGRDPSLVIDPGGTTRVVKEVIFAAGDTQLVSVGDDKIIRIWDITTGKTVRTIRDQVTVCLDCKISAMALSRNNEYLAVGGQFPGSDLDTRFAIYVYDFQTGKRIALLKGHQARVTALAFSPFGAQLASGSAVTDGGRRTDVAGSVRTWKLGAQGWEKSRALSEHDDFVRSVAFSPDESQLVSAGHDTKVVLWNLNSNAERKVLKGHSDIVSGAVFSPDGRFIISGGWDRKINLWDAQGNLVREFSQQSDSVASLKIGHSKDHPRLLVGLANGMSQVLSVPGGESVGEFKGGDDKVYAAAFSRTDDNVVATSGGYNGEIWVWRVDNPSPVRLLSGKGQTVWKVGFSEKGDSIAFGTEHTRDVPNRYGQLTRIIHLKSVFAGSSSDYRFSLGGIVGAGDKFYSELEKVTVKGEGNSIYELKTRYGETVKRKVNDKLIDEPVRLNELQIFKDTQKYKEIRRTLDTGRTHRAYTFTPDGRYIISGGEDGYLALYETKNPSQPVHLFYGHTGDIWSVAVSPDGRFIISGSSDQTIKLWHIKYDQCLVSFFIGSDFEWVAWTPQGYYTSSFRGDRYIGWQVEETGAEQPVFYGSDQFAKIFNRPEVVSRYLAVPDIREAVKETPLNIGQQTSLDRNTVFTAQALMKSLPPKINILSLAPDQTFSQRIIPLKVSITSDDLPITDVVVSLNGSVTGSYQGGNSKKVEIETSVALKPGQNTLVIVASNEQARSAPEVRTIFLSTPPPRGVPGQIKPVPIVAKMLTDSWTSKGGFAPDEPATFTITKPAAPQPPQPPQPMTTTNDYLPMEIKVETVPPNTKLRVLVNNVERNKKNVISGEKWVLQVPLDEGENKVKVVTTTNDVDSEPQFRDITYRQEIDGRPKLIFLGIGISNYSHLTPALQYGDKDARDLREFLDKLKGNPYFRDVKTEVLSNADAKHSKILEKVKWLNEEATNDNDIRIVLISGHGGVYPRAVPQYYLFSQNYEADDDPEEFESANWHTVLARLFNSEVNYGQGYLVLLVDTCRAGAASPRVSQDFNNISKVVFFGSSSENQQSIERDGNGVFTKIILDGLKGGADTNKDGKVDNSELYSWLLRKLPEENSGQTLQYDPSRSLQLFNIATTTATPSADSIAFKKVPQK